MNTMKEDGVEQQLPLSAEPLLIVEVSNARLKEVGVCVGAEDDQLRQAGVVDISRRGEAVIEERIYVLADPRVERVEQEVEGIRSSRRPRGEARRSASDQWATPRLAVAPLPLAELDDERDVV